MSDDGSSSARVSSRADADVCLIWQVVYLWSVSRRKRVTVSGLREEKKELKKREGGEGVWDSADKYYVRVLALRQDYLSGDHRRGYRRR